MKKAWLFLSTIVLLAACEADKIGPQELNPGPKPVLNGRQVLLTNEGNFQRGNASISAYNPQRQEVQHHIYRNFNEQLPLGDVAQDLQAKNGRYFISLNNSGKVSVVDTTTWKEVAAIEGMETPRYLSFSEDKVFITDLFARRLWVAGLNNLNLETHIPLPAPGFHTRNWRGKIMVGAADSLLQIDPASLTIESSRPLPGKAEKMAVDNKGHLWILSTGQNAERALVEFNSEFEEISRWMLQDHLPGEAAQNLCTRPQGQNLYFTTGQAIYRVALNSASPHFQALATLADHNVYAFGVDPQTGELYLADALDFDQAADIYRYQPNGQLIHKFKGGVNTTAFYFQAGN